MTTLTKYHPRNLELDLAADCPSWLYNEIVSLHGHIEPPPAPPVLSCVGNGEPLYIYRHHSGRYFARHYPNGNPQGHSHHIARMSDEHRREAEYTQRGAIDRGLNATLEHPTGNHTRLDVAVFGERNVGVEIQRSELSRAQAKRRAALSFEAGWPTVWISDSDRVPDWMQHVPSAQLTKLGWGWEALPPPNTLQVSIARFVRERDKSRPTGWWYIRKAKAVLLDELPYLTTIGEIVPVTVGKMGAVVLADKTAPGVIDSCTYPGASHWRPTKHTPRHREAAQRISRKCQHNNFANGSMNVSNDTKPWSKETFSVPPKNDITELSKPSYVWNYPNDWPSVQFIESIY